MTRFLASSALAAALLVAAAPLHAQQQGNPLPQGEGRDIVAVACTQCHGPTAFTNLRESADAWRDQVYDMILRGAQVGPSEIDKAVTYLATNFGPGVNVPPATVQVTLPDGAGKDLVEANCVVCHGLDKVAATKRTPGEWKGVLSRMVFYGAPASADDVKKIGAYLDDKLAVK